MIILVKKPKNVQILAKMRKFKFFHNFKTPQGVDRKPEKKSKKGPEGGKSRYPIVFPPLNGLKTATGVI